ncbi:Patatin-like phospholipase-containing protein [Venustampulla echinocandica]|uniref:Patatin-like phospholipase domain-containing protein n=1 Tax=Venustampulla echinocandica TaxID=2656787 RepID=A0A370TAP1_9HELO|nr:Patatin-like phospholipase-containing protein [Venustampulla echinocandica]RDL30982.1 Patatin-like phospholipase-containing protein [Venustampulla echinocandica]
MVLLEYLQKTSLLCADDSNAPKLLATSTPTKGYLQNDDGGRARRNVNAPLSQQTWSLLGPAAKILRGGVDMVNNTVATLRDGLTEEDRIAQAKIVERRQILALRVKNAETVDQWKAAAKELDILEDNEAWKQDSTSSEFDAALIEDRLKQLDDARISCDVRLMLNQVRTALSRDLGGMGNIELYKHSHIGTKDLIERYIDSTLDTIQAIVALSKHNLPEGLGPKDVLEQIVYARQAFGRSALLLSGGATFGMNHIGVLKTLHEAKLLPRIISGASAGSIVCAVLCTRTDEEIPEVLKMFPYGDLAVFEEEGKEDGVLERLRRLLTQGSWIDIKHLTRVMHDMLGDMTFQEGYNRTRRILNICVSSASVYELPRLLNYVTAPNVMIWSAVAASCSVPFVFSAAQLLVKDPLTGDHNPWNPTPQLWIDGSVDNDLPMTRLAEMFNVNHFIVSQVNPHVVPFLVKDDDAITKAAQSENDSGPGWVYTITSLAKDEALHRMQVLAELGVFPNLVTKCKSILSQKYSGDITILPQIYYKDFPRILKNPTSDFMVQACLSGERATWPKLSRVRNHCAVELALDAAVQQLRARVVFSPSQVDLRRLTTGSLRNAPGYLRRKRGNSSSAIHTLEPRNNAAVEEGVNNAKNPSSRPPLRASNSHWGITRRYLSPMAPSNPQSPDDAFHNSKEPLLERALTSTKAPGLHRQMPASSATETATPHSAFSSDADIDSHTDSSSAEPDVGDTSAKGLSLYYGKDSQSRDEADELDYFSQSQPITPKSDHVLATSPSLRSNIGFSMSTRTIAAERKKPS